MNSFCSFTVFEFKAIFSYTILLFCVILQNSYIFLSVILFACLFVLLCNLRSYGYFGLVFLLFLTSRTRFLLRGRLPPRERWASWRWRSGTDPRPGGTHAPTGSICLARVMLLWLVMYLICLVLILAGNSETSVHV